MRSSYPSIVFFMNGHYRLIRIKDYSELYAATLSSKSQVRKLSEWVANDSKLLEDAFDHDYHKFATETLGSVDVSSQP
jgi:hypothetical protein